jgi:hypothetical protein
LTSLHGEEEELETEEGEETIMLDVEITMGKMTESNRRR